MSSDTLSSQRDPDGAPPEVIGLTAFCAFLLAGLIAVLLWTKTAAGVIAAGVIAIVAVPALTAGLSRRAKRLRGDAP